VKLICFTQQLPFSAFTEQHRKQQIKASAACIEMWAVKNLRVFHK
jgi:hypothetical protein